MARSKIKEPGPPKSSGKLSKAVNTNLSQEFVGDSDDSADPESAAADNTRKLASHVKTTKAKPSKKSAPAPAQPHASASDSSQSEDTSDDSESESGSTSESSESKEAAPASTTKSAGGKGSQKLNGVKRKADESSSSEPSSGSTSSDDEDNSEPEKKRAKAATSAAGSSGTSVQTSSASTHIYTPPSGFLAMNKTLAKDRPLVNRSSLAGKQIWHLSAPSHVPLSTLTNFTVDQIRTGKPVLTHDGVEYVLAETATSTVLPSVYLPDKDGFSKAPQPVSRVFTLQPSIVLPNLTAKQANPATGSAAAADVGRASVTTVRPQPKGLRMRFRPAGFGAGRPGRIGSSSESESDGDDDTGAKRAPTFQFPRVTGGAHGGSERRGDGRIDATTPQKQRDGKKKSHKSKTSAFEETEDVTSVTSKKKKRDRDAASGHDSSTALSSKRPAQSVVAPEIEMEEAPDLNGGSPDTGAREKKRKEEKMRRKEEKRLAKVARAS